MSKKPGTKPNTIRVQKDIYRATVLKVLGRDVHGRPNTARVVHDDEAIDISDGDEFIIVYMPEREVKKRPSN